MNRYQTLFATLAARGEGAFVPFVMLGDPGLEESLAVIDALIEGGADALELGIPFSDPVADGPVIQAAANRALAAGVTPTACFALLRRIRAKYPALPIGLLIYSNLVAHGDAEAFFRELAEAGVDSVLIADVPSVEIEPVASLAQAAGIALVLVVPPNANRETIARIARCGSGYTYLQGRAGVTGTDNAMQRPAEALIAALKAENAAPALIGFGVSSPEHVQQALAAGAAGAIAGSAVVNLVERYHNAPETRRRALIEFVAGMKAATRR